MNYCPHVGFIRRLGLIRLEEVLTSSGFCETRQPEKKHTHLGNDSVRAIPEMFVPYPRTAN